jgi:hypothetical protein
MKEKFITMLEGKKETVSTLLRKELRDRKKRRRNT